MSNIDYSITRKDGGSASISVFGPDFEKVVTSGHPFFGDLVTYLTANEDHDVEHVRDLVDPTRYIGKQMAEISPDLTWDLYHLYYQGVRVSGDLSDIIRARISANDNEWQRLAKFLVNLEANPSARAKEATWQWVKANGLTLTEDGRFLGYKAVQNDGLSSSSGPNNFVDGVLLNNGATCRVPHEIGSVISKRRADVDDTPGGGCSVGLHVGTLAYAQGFAPRLMTVAVDPRNVVSAPDHNLEYKIRVCEYEVISLADPVQFAHTSYNVSDTLPDEEESSEDVVADLDPVEVAVATADALSEDSAPKTKVLDDWAQENDDLRADLLNTHLGHKPLARKWSSLTTESSVRRWRKAHNVVLSLGTRISDALD